MTTDTVPPRRKPTVWRYGTETTFRVGPETLRPTVRRACPRCHRSQWKYRYLSAHECEYCGWPADDG